MTFGANLSDLRKKVGMSQDEVSQALGLTRPAYKQIETDEREPSIAERRAISELFGVRIDSLRSDISDQVREGKLATDELDKIKYQNLILYLAQKVGARPNVGETVFYKLIYFIETLSRSRNGQGITNESFYKMQYGPVPISFQSVTEEMINRNELDKVTGRYFTYMQTKYLPRVQFSGLSQDDLSIIHEVINTLGDKTATELSDLSHMDKPWIDAEIGDTLELERIKNTDSSWAKLMGRDVTAIT